MSKIPSDEKLTEIVDRIQAGEQGAVEELYIAFRAACRHRVYMRLWPEDTEDALHDAFVAILQAVRVDKVNRKTAVIGYAQSVAYRKVLKVIEFRVRRREQPDIDIWLSDFKFVDTPHSFHSKACPHKTFERSEKIAIMREEFSKLKPKEQEILQRYYFGGEKIVDIQAAMGLSANKFRLDKCRAKQKLEKAVALRLAKRPRLARAA